MKTDPINQLKVCRRRHAGARRPHHALRITFHVSRFTLPVSRITHRVSRPGRAFTLIELLIVISIIALLASLSFPAVRAARMSVMRARARAELMQIETAIESYQRKLGYYPPDNQTKPPNWELNQLYYELEGTTNSGGIYHTLDDSAQISASALSSVFGPNVSGFMNCMRPGRGDDVPNAASFLPRLKAGQFMAVGNTPNSPTVIGSTLDGPFMYSNPSTGARINPWRYNSSSPRHNAKTFDLWIDVLAGGKTNRICNWSDKSIVVYYTSPANEYP